ncbi:MAG: LD-carboxypeptidase [Spirosomataceae bacterium]
MENQLFRPPLLKKGDKVGIVSMASRVKPEAVLRAKDYLEQWGLEVVLGKSFSDVHFNFAGTDEARKKDLQYMLDDHEIKAIFSSRGGYGVSRILDSLNFYLFKKSPKWLIGFSDITALHAHLFQMGYQSIHGPMPTTFPNDAYSLEALRTALFYDTISYSVDYQEDNRIGEGIGQIIGGNLCLLAHTIGSPSDFSFDGKILVLEEVGEPHYNVDRMVLQLKRAGKLKNLAGLVVGQFSEMKDPVHQFGKTAYEIIAEHTAGTNYPIVYDFPIGHTKANYAFRSGETMKLSVSESGTQLSTVR